MYIVNPGLVYKRIAREPRAREHRLPLSSSDVHERHPMTRSVKRLQYAKIEIVMIGHDVNLSLEIDLLKLKAPHLGVQHHILLCVKHLRLVVNMGTCHK